MKRKTTKEFINGAKKVHGDKYDYSKVNYIGNKNKIIITCLNHGDFKQSPIDHINGNGCQECFNEKRKSGNLKMNTKLFLKLLNNNFPKNNYDYSKVNYINAKTPITIICPIHGEFNRNPDYIIQSKKICKKCHKKKEQPSKLTTKKFINRAKKIHGDKYDYSKVNYINAKTPVIIICPIHGEFTQISYNHINEKNYRGCSDCGIKYDKTENDLKTFIKSLNIKFESNKRTLLGNKQEVDIYLPDFNLGIEFNGLYWHSDLKVDNNYHLIKTESANSNGFNLIHIFEDEWLYKKEIVKSRIRNILGLTTDRVYGRKCEVKEVSIKKAKEFTDKHHLQGYTNSSVKLGLYYDNELISCMLFSKPRLGIGQNFDGYELTRFCNKLNTTVIGGASKLLKNFIKNYKPKEIRSYADRRWSQGGLYDKLGFIKETINRPNYWYVKNLKRYHRFNFRKHKLKDMGYKIDTLTEKEIMTNLGYYRIYDCGTIKYSLTLDN